MKGDPLLTIPLSLILSYSHSKLNLHFVIYYDHSFSRCKVVKDVLVP